MGEICHHLRLRWEHFQQETLSGAVQQHANVQFDFKRVRRGAGRCINKDAAAAASAARLRGGLLGRHVGMNSEHTLQFPYGPLSF